MSIPVVARTRFMIGKYEVIAEPIPHSMQMLRYNVYLDRKRIGATVSMPSESDCRFLEKPPVVPPLKVFYVTSRPGRPKKGATKPAAVVLERNQPGFREELPADVSLDSMGGKGEDR
jgi:hypothetical protein